MEFYQATFANGSFFESFRDDPQAARIWRMSLDEWNTHLDEMHANLMKKGIVWRKFIPLVSKYYDLHVRVSDYRKPGQTFSIHPSGHPTVHFSLTSDHMEFIPEPSDKQRSDALYRHCEKWQLKREEMALTEYMAAAANDDSSGDEWAFNLSEIEEYVGPPYM